ncbi:zinc finger, CCHC-type containing protein [Tanacetum coccineum]
MIFISPMASALYSLSSKLKDTIRKKMHFLLSSMSVVYVLTTYIPEDGETATMEQIRRRNKWVNNDYVCRGLILNGMSDPLFDVYQNVESFIELWDSLEAKYMAEDASSKEFLVSYIIDKLPPSWKDIKHTLKHKKEELTLVELGRYLRIEESLRVQDSDKPKGNNVVGPSVVNMVEHNNSIRYNEDKGKRKHQDTKVDPNKKSKVTCWKCGKPGHLKKDCKGRKVGNKANGSGANDSVNSSSNSLKGAIVRVCKYRCWFKNYESLNDGSILHIGNESTTLVHGRGCVDLRFSSGKIVSLFNVLHVPNFRKNLVSSMFRLNIVNDNIGSTFMSTSKLNDSILWHARLGHVVAQQPEPKLRKSKRNRTPKNFGPKFQLYLIEGTMDEKEAINDEMNSIMGNDTWVLADLPLVERMSTIRLLIALALIHNLIIHQMDVKTTSLNGKLDEDVYMNQPQGFIMPGNENKVHVDMTKEFLSSRFSMKKMGEADVILGIRIKHESNGIAISQSHYIEKVLKKFNYFDCSLASSPTDTSEKLMPNNGQTISNLEYSRVIGCLMYAMTYTRLDIAFVVSKLSRIWQKKMRFLLSSMSVVYVLTTYIPEDGETATMEQIRRRNKWVNDDYVCRGLILNDIKHTLKHKKEELTLVELDSHLSIEESLRVQDSDKPNGNNVVGPSIVNMVKHNNSIRYNENKGKCKHQDTKVDPNKKSKVTCWKFGKPGHLKKDWKGRKVGNKANGSGVNDSVNGSSNSLKGHNMFNNSL